MPNLETNQLERRTLQGVELRIVNEEGQPPTIVGTAAVFNSPSEILFNHFRELIEPGFFENVLTDDVRALWNHNADLVLGRSKNGTLSMAETPTGLEVRIQPPDTQAGRDALTSISRGDVDQMSFAFDVKVGGDEWAKQADGALLRVLKRGGCERLYDVSPVAYPAYPTTSVQVRARVAELTEDRLPRTEMDLQNDRRRLELEEIGNR